MDDTVIAFVVSLGMGLWLADVVGERGLYATALVSGMVDIDPIVLSALNLYGEERLAASAAVLWFNRRIAARAVWPLAASVAGGSVALVLA